MFNYIRYLQKTTVNATRYKPFDKGLTQIHKNSLRGIKYYFNRNLDLVDLFVREEPDAKVQPGLTDHDLTAVFSRNECPLSFIGNFWNKYKKIKVFIPQTGEVDLFNEDEFEDYLKFGPGPTNIYKNNININSQEVATRVSHFHITEKNQFREHMIRYANFIQPSIYSYLSEKNHYNYKVLIHGLDKILKRNNAYSYSDSAEDKLAKFYDLDYGINPKVSKKYSVPIAVSNASSKLIRSTGRELLEAFKKIVNENSSLSCSIVVWKTFRTQSDINLAVIYDDWDCFGNMEPTLLAITQFIKTHGLRWQKLFSKDFSSCSGLRYPLFLSRKMWNQWLQSDPFVSLGILSSNPLVDGNSRILDSIQFDLSNIYSCISNQYAAVMSLKNNWRVHNGPALLLRYDFLANQILGYESILNEAPATDPQKLDFCSIKEGFDDLTNKLSLLRSQLISLPHNN